MHSELEGLHDLVAAVVNDLDRNLAGLGLLQRPKPLRRSVRCPEFRAQRAHHPHRGVLLDRKKWKTRVELANAMFDYLEIWHNRRRRHSQLGWLTPIEFERVNTITVA
jgi:transposase InsO family protein